MLSLSIVYAVASASVVVNSRTQPCGDVDNGACAGAGADALLKRCNGTNERARACQRRRENCAIVVDTLSTEANADLLAWLQPLFPPTVTSWVVYGLETMGWKQFPANPVRQFQIAYCLWLAISLMYTLRAHTRFLAWFDGSGLQLARKRGLGAHPSKLYGLFSPPTLTAPQLRVVGIVLIGCLLASCGPAVPRVFIFMSYLLSLCYFPQLFAEVSCSGHSTILIPSILFILTCSPSLDHAVQSQVCKGCVRVCKGCVRGV